MNTNPTQFPLPSDRTITIPPRPRLLLVDRDDTAWWPTGRYVGGEAVLECVSPLDPDDCGEGESHDWTLPQIKRWFSPLTEMAA